MQLMYEFCFNSSRKHAEVDHSKAMGAEDGLLFHFIQGANLAGGVV